MSLATNYRIWRLAIRSLKCKTKFLIRIQFYPKQSNFLLDSNCDHLVYRTSSHCTFPALLLVSCTLLISNICNKSNTSSCLSRWYPNPRGAKPCHARPQTVSCRWPTARRACSVALMCVRFVEGEFRIVSKGRFDDMKHILVARNTKQSEQNKRFDKWIWSVNIMIVFTQITHDLLHHAARTIKQIWKILPTCAVCAIVANIAFDKFIPEIQIREYISLDGSNKKETASTVESR